MTTVRITTSTPLPSIKWTGSWHCSSRRTGARESRWIWMLIDHYYRIRATWTTQAIKLFLDSLDPFRYQKRKCEIFARPSSHTWELMPSLLPSKLDRIDNLLTRGHNPPNLMSVREGVAGSRDTRPDVSPARKQKNPWQRVLCEKLEEKPVLGVCFFYLGHFWLTSMFILTVRCTILWSWMICQFISPLRSFTP